MPPAGDLAIASVAAFALALMSALAGFGGGVLLLPVFTGLFGLRMAVPMLTLTQLSSNASRVVFNWRDIRWSLVGWFSLGAVPLAVVGALLLANAPLAPLKRVLGVFLIGVVVWRHVRKAVRRPADKTFIGIGAASGFGSALLGSVGPLTAPFFLAYGLARAAYVGTEAAGALVTHGVKLAAYGSISLMDKTILVYGVLLTPSVIAGAWVGKHILNRINDKVFVLLVEIGLVASGLFYLVGL